MKTTDVIEYIHKIHSKKQVLKNKKASLIVKKYAMIDAADYRQKLINYMSCTV